MLPRGPIRVNLRRLRQREHTVHDRSKLARFQQVGYPVKLLLIRLHDEEGLPHAAIRGTLCGRNDRHDSATGLDDSPGALQSFTADGIKDDVYPVHAFFKAGSAAVNHQFRAERCNKCGIGWGRRRNHVRATEARELDGEGSHRSRAAMHQNTLAGLQFRAIEETLPGGESADRHRRRFDMVSRDGFGATA